MVLKDDGTVWWEGLDGEKPAHGIDWKGNEWTPESGTPGAHPNSRFTAPAAQCPCISPKFTDPEGVPIDAIIFGGRRAKTAPLVYQAFDWQHGTFVGATMASETTAAASGAVGQVRRDPMAMIPFAGYDMGDYFQHWLDMEGKIANPPKIFHVNWFRQDDNGKFIWPGFGDNVRVLNWIVDRCDGKVDADETPIGYVPKIDDINIDGLNITEDTIKELLKVDKSYWADDIENIKEFFKKVGDRMPKEIYDELAKLEERFGK